MIQKADLQRFSLYTFLLGIGIYIYGSSLPPTMVDISKGLIVSVVICVYYVYLHYGFQTVIQFYQRIAPWIKNPVGVALLDVLMHTLPWILVGNPMNWTSYVIAYQIIITWYVWVRPIIPHLYMKELSLNEYDQILGIVLPLGLIGMYFLTVNW